MAGNSKLIADYVQSKYGDGIFGHPTTYDEQRAVFRNKNPVYDLECAIRQYQELDCTPRLGFTLETCTWDHIYGLFGSAQNQYESKGKGLSGFARKVFRKVGDNADDIKSGLDMVETSSLGIQVLIASLGWMLQLAKHRASKRDLVFSTFNNIPAMIESTEEEIKRFTGNRALSDLANQLYDVVITGVSKMIKWLLPKHICEKIFNTAKGPWDDEIDDVVAELNKATREFEHCAENLLKDLSVSTHREVKQVKREAAAIRSNTVSISGEVRQGFDDLKVAVGGLDDRMSRLELRAIDEQESNKNQWSIRTQNFMFRFLEEKISQIAHAELEELLREEQRRRLPQLDNTPYNTTQLARTYPTVAYAYLSVAEVLSALRISLEGITTDLNLVIRHGMQWDPAAQSRTQSLLQESRFWTWLSSSTSDMLLVESLPSPAGGMGLGPDRISPLSFVCANIIANIIKSYPRAVPTYYFCGLHERTGDDLRGPQGLIRCIIAKLLMELQSRHPNAAEHFAFTFDATSDDEVFRYGMTELCTLFRYVVAQFPAQTTIYCILDGLYFYEKPEFQYHATLLMHALIDLVESPWTRNAEPVVRILLTTPCRSNTIRSVLPMDRRIVVGSGLLEQSPYIGRTGFTNFGLDGLRIPRSPRLGPRSIRGDISPRERSEA